MLANVVVRYVEVIDQDNLDSYLILILCIVAKTYNTFQEDGIDTSNLSPWDIIARPRVQMSPDGNIRGMFECFL